MFFLWGNIDVILKLDIGKPTESCRSWQRKEERTIRDRPESAKTREEFGHWEMDLVEGQRLLLQITAQNLLIMRV